MTTLLLIGIAVVLILVVLYKLRSKEGFTIVKNQPEIQNGYECVDVYAMNSVDPNYGYSTASLHKVTKNGKITLSVEANLPLAEGGDFNNEDLEYYLTHKDEKLVKLERDLDRFYRGRVEISAGSEPTDIVKIKGFGSKGVVDILQT